VRLCALYLGWGHTVLMHSCWPNTETGFPPVLALRLTRHTKPIEHPWSSGFELSHIKRVRNDDFTTAARWKKLCQREKKCRRPVTPLRFSLAAPGTGEIYRSTADWPVTKNKLCTPLVVTLDALEPVIEKQRPGVLQPTGMRLSDLITFKFKLELRATPSCGQSSNGSP
jgi:hypothetical protein